MKPENARSPSLPQWLRSVTHYLYSIFTSAPDTRLLKNAQLYNHADRRVNKIIQKGQEMIQPDPEGKIHPAKLARMLNGDKSDHPDHLHPEVVYHLQHIVDKSTLNDIADPSGTLATDFLEFVVDKGADFQPVTFCFDEDKKFRSAFAPEVKDFFCLNHIDETDQHAITAILDTLTQLTLELVCTENSRLPDWLTDPKTFDLAAICRSPAEQKQAMPVIMNAVLQVLTPVACIQHTEHFGSLMMLVMLIVQRDILNISSDVVDACTTLHTPDELINWEEISVEDAEDFIIVQPCSVRHDGFFKVPAEGKAPISKMAVLHP